MTPSKSNIVLIGMPGSGKSTVGVQLAKILGKDFVDTDILIQNQHGRTLQAILDNEGYLQLRYYEQEVLLSTNFKNTVIATGGSAVYGEQGMVHLSKDGIIVYLTVSLSSLKQRISNEGQRGIARPKEQSFEAVFHERLPLYKKYADVVIDNDKGLDIDNIVSNLKKVITK